MKCVEIVSVRISGIFGQQAHFYLNAFCRVIKEPLLAKASVYVNADDPSDLVIILSWEGELLKEEKTDVGLRLAAALKRFGLVDHVFWLMTEYPDQSPSLSNSHSRPIPPEYHSDRIGKNDSVNNQGESII